MSIPQPAEIIDLAHRFDAATHELQMLNERRNQMVRLYRETGNRGDPAEWHRIQADRVTTGQLVEGLRTALAALVALIPPSPAAQAMTLADYRALPPEYKDCIRRWEAADDAAGRKDGGQ